MLLATTPPSPRRRFLWFGGSGGGNNPALWAPDAQTPDPDPLVCNLARSARAVGSETRVGEVTEILRSSPYRAVAVVEPTPSGFLLTGLVTERSLARVLLSASTPTERARVRGQTVREIAQPPHGFVTAYLRASDAAARFDLFGEETLPVVEERGGDGGGLYYLGLLSRGDLVQELSRPFRPPTIGGLATPTGVYLTTGVVSGGAGTRALIGSGLMLWASNTIATMTLGTLHRGASSGSLLGAMSGFLTSDVVAPLITMAVYLSLIRLTPIAGYHAAEHQVVHAVERGEPLLVDFVRAMPRVHPRCGTNLVAGLTLFTLLGGALAPLILRFAPALDGVGWAIAGLVALTLWRTVGAWLQQHVTTRPATDAQLESGIRAAREVLNRHGRAPDAIARPHQRLWRMGFVQMLVGYVIGYAVLAALVYLFPSLNRTLGPLSPL